VKVTNHLDVKITSEKTSGVEPDFSNLSMVSICPNPVKSGQPFTIRLSSEFSDAWVSIYNLLGVKLSECKANGALAEQSIEQQGIYILEVKKDAQQFTTKIIVKC
jgi:hypothetical protein